MVPLHQVPKPPLEGKLVLPDDKLCYLAAGNGLFKQIRNDFYTARVKVAGVANLAQVEEDAELNVPKLPLALFRQIEAFFVAVYAKHKAEAVVLLLCSPAAHTWRAEVPPQVVRGLHVTYDLSTLTTPPAGFERFGTIHSHAQAKAFHSGTDDSDEAAFDGLHITIGNVDQPVRTYAARWMLAGKVFPSSLANVVEGEPLPACDPEWLNQVREEAPTLLGEMGSGTHETGPATREPVLDPFGDFGPEEFADLDQYREYLLDTRQEIEERLKELRATKKGATSPCFDL